MKMTNDSNDWYLIYCEPSFIKLAGKGILMGKDIQDFDGLI